MTVFLRCTLALGGAALLFACQGEVSQTSTTEEPAAASEAVKSEPVSVFRLCDDRGDDQTCRLADRDGVPLPGTKGAVEIERISARAHSFKRKGMLHLVLPDGTIIPLPDATGVRSGRDGVWVVNAKGGAGLIDGDGTYRLTTAFDTLAPNGEKLWSASSDGQRHLLDGEGTVLQSFDDEGYVLSKFGMPIHELNDAVILFSSDGKTRIGQYPKDTRIIAPDRLSLKSEDGTGQRLTRLDGTPVSETIFEALSAMEWSADADVDTLIAAKSGDGWGYVDRDGVWMIAPQFSHAKPFRGNAALVQVDGLAGLINRKGEWLLEPEFDRVDNRFDLVWVLGQDAKSPSTTPEEDRFLLAKDGAYSLYDGMGRRRGYIGDGRINMSGDRIHIEREFLEGRDDLNGDTVVPILYDDVYGLSDGYYTARFGTFVRAVDTDGTLIGHSYKDVKEERERISRTNGGAVTLRCTGKHFAHGEDDAKPDAPTALERFYLTVETDREDAHFWSVR